MTRRFAIAVCFCLSVLFGCGGEEVGGGPGEGTPQNLGAISVRVPPGWVVESPSSSMRKAQYRLPQQGGDHEDASLVVFYFGAGQGGSIEANLERWFGQFKQPDGSASREKARVERKTVSGMEVTVADVSGTYASSAMGPRMPAGDPKPNHRMLAGIVETPRGSYFFKLTGPEQTVAHWKGSFDRFVESVRSGEK